MSRYVLSSLILAGLLMSASNAYSQSANPQTLKQRKRVFLDAQITQAKADVINIEKRIAEMTVKLRELKSVQKDLRAEHDEKGVSDVSFSEVIKTLQAMRVDLMIDIAGLEARRETVIELKKEMEKASEELIIQLQELLAIEEDRLAKTEKLFKSGAASNSDFQQAKARMLEVRIRIAEAKQPGKSNSMLNDQLLNSSLERAEKKARLEKTESLLQTFTKSRSSLENAAANERKIEHTTNEIVKAETFLADAMANLDTLQAELQDLLKQEEKIDQLDQ